MTKQKARKRYEVAVAKPDDPVCYVRNCEFTSLSDAKEACETISAGVGRECIVVDHEENGYPIVFRSKPTERKPNVGPEPAAPQSGPPDAGGKRTGAPAKPQPKYRR